MANIKITDLPAAASTTGADVFPIVQSDTTKKAALSLLPVSTATQTALDAKVDDSQLGQPSGVATLDSGGKLTSSQIPAIAVSDYLGAVADQAAMLALTGQSGDWCSRTDLGTSWIITGSDPTQIGSWTQLSYPTAPVISVNSKTGAVVLDNTDVGAAATTHADTHADGGTDSIQPFAGVLLDTASPDASPSVGQFVWNDTEGTATMLLKGGNVTLPLGDAVYHRVYNNSGAAFTKGQVVYLSGSQGQRVVAALADNNSEATAGRTFGFVAEPIDNNSEGFIIAEGVLSGVSTQGFADGTVLWLGENGAYIATNPLAPKHGVFLGVVIKGNSGGGSIFVKINNGSELDELHDVLISAVFDREVLTYNAAASRWINRKLEAQYIDGISVFGRSLIDDANASAAKTTLEIAFGTTATTFCVGNDARLVEVENATDFPTRGTLVRRNAGDGNVTFENLTVLASNSPYNSGYIVNDIFGQGENTFDITNTLYLDNFNRPNIVCFSNGTIIHDLTTSFVTSPSSGLIWNVDIGGGNLVVGGNNTTDPTIIGTSNTILGSNAANNLSNINRASNCVFVGANTGRNCNKTNITAVGYNAYNTGTGVACTAVGSASLSQVSGGNNVGVGNNTGNAISTGANNTCIGSQAGANTLTTGQSNTLIGQAANVGAGDRFRGIALGYRTTTHDTLNGTLHIGGVGAGVAMDNLTTATAPTGASTYLRVWLNGTEYRIQAQAA